MGIDIRTMAIILGVTHFIQVIVFLHQYRINKVYQGIGWWLAWSVSEVIGFAFILLRGIPSIQSQAIIGQNTLIILGTIFLYVGVMRFLDKKENRRIILSIFVVFIVTLVFFLYAHDSIAIRGVIIGITLASISFLTAHGLFVHKTPSIAASANFNFMIFLIHGCIFLHRAVMILLGTPVASFFSQTLFNVIPFLDALIVSLLWTFGFVIMVSQRLNSELTEAKVHFEDIFNTIPDGVLITRLNDGIILDVNRGFTTITGYTRDESIGKSSVEIKLWKHPDERRNVTDELLKNGFCDNFESIFLRKDGSEIIGLMSAKFITLQRNPHIISVTRDITVRKQAEEKLKLLLKEKEMLIREVHHRVKNNFAVVSSLLGLQSRDIHDTKVKAMFMQSRDRINSMALLHQRLYQAHDLTHINFSEYIRTLAADLFKTYEINQARISTVIEVDDVILDIDKVLPCGLIVNELISNALKYGFPKSRTDKGQITVSFHQINGNEVELVVMDNGVGLPDDFNIGKSKSLGLQLVNMMAEDQLRGKLKVNGKGGAEFRIQFALNPPEVLSGFTS